MFSVIRLLGVLLHPVLARFGPHVEQLLHMKVSVIAALHLLMNDIQEEIGWVLVGRQHEALGLEVRHCEGAGALVHLVASCGQQQHLIIQPVDAVAWLVDDHDAGHAAAREQLEAVEHRLRGGGVQAAGRLVQKEEARLRHKLHADIHTLSLAAADAALLHAANNRVHDVAKLQQLARVAYHVHALLVVERVWQPHTGREVEDLLDSEILVDGVVLRNKALDGADQL
mmetsp:Transcript_20167/g.51635  ORF Transcript_20167/g.51635 Transcript_20167/m.51635 type:complete len:227 (+) Transcript_20167:807-1487(+)